MRRTACTLTLVALFAAGAGAAEETGIYSYCHGYIKMGLADDEVAGLDRLYLWLAWNETVRQIVIEGELGEARYEAGRNAYRERAGAGVTEAVRTVTEGDCRFGRNSTWRWW